MTEAQNADKITQLGLLRRSSTYVAAGLAGLILWLIVWGGHLGNDPQMTSDDIVGLIGSLMLLDMMLGAIAISLLPLRQRVPRTIAVISALMLTASATAGYAAGVSVVRACMVVGRLGIVALGGVWGLALIGNATIFSSVGGASTSTLQTGIVVLVGLLIYSVLVAAGRYRRARAETLALLRERAESAERRRDRDILSAKESERLRIAREMHDVLAHRISLVSMHAGALTYRQDLDREQISRAAQVIHDNSALALSELRELLGILRSTEQSELLTPQPTLDDLPDLLADIRASGAVLEVQFHGLEVPQAHLWTATLEESRSRTAYRVIQEALTNARKHAPGEAVQIQVRREGDRLTIQAQNMAPECTGDGHTSGLGLVGLAERVELAGGSTHSERTREGVFVLNAWLPWS